jgi:hypothetical protein
MNPKELFEGCVAILDGWDMGEKLLWQGEPDLWEPSPISQALRFALMLHEPHRAFHNTEKFTWECACTYGLEAPCQEMRYIAYALGLLSEDESRGYSEAKSLKEDRVTAIFAELRTHFTDDDYLELRAKAVAAWRAIEAEPESES